MLPGHGAPVHGVEAVRANLDAELEYLRRAGRQVCAGELADTDDIVESLVADTKDRWPIERYQMVNRHRNVVIKMFEEVGAGSAVAGWAPDS